MVTINSSMHKLGKPDSIFLHRPLEICESLTIFHILCLPEPPASVVV